MDTLLLNAAGITALTQAQPNLDAHALEVEVPLAQRRHLRPVLGAALFAALLVYAKGAGQTLPDPLPEGEPLAALWAECRPALARWALVEAWPHLQAQVSNAGIINQLSRDGGMTTADRLTTETALAAHRDTATFLTEELRAWLVAHAAEFTAYLPAPAVAPAEAQGLVGGIQFS